MQSHLRALALLLALSPALAEPVAGAEPWRPPAEPPAWARIRRRLVQLDPPAGLAERQWVFMRSLDQPEMQAGEYLAEIQGSGQGEEETAEFAAVVLLRRGGPAGRWLVRERRMRVRCGSGALEAADARGQWLPYEGQPDAESSARRGWICAQAGARPAGPQP